MNSETIKNRPSTTRLMRLKEVIQVTGMSRSYLYKCISDGKFPNSVSLGERSVAWVDHEVQAWIATKIHQRDNLIA